MKSGKKVMTILLFLMSLVLIVFLTFQNTSKSGALSEHILDSIYRFEERTGLYKYPFVGYMMLDYIHFRKIGHFVEYFILGLSSMFLFRKSKHGFLKAAGLCALISFSDQLIKAFLPGREFDWTDFPYDIAGYLTGAFIIFIIRKIRSKRKLK